MRGNDNYDADSKYCNMFCLPYSVLYTLYMHPMRIANVIPFLGLSSKISLCGYNNATEYYFNITALELQSK